MHSEDLILYRGDTFKMDIELLDDQGAPLDLDGVQIDCTVRLGDYAFSPVISHIGNVISLTILPQHTKGREERIGKYDVQLTQGDIVTTVVRGAVKLQKDITL